MKILVVSLFPPVWHTPSYKRMLNFAEQLSKEHEVSLLAPEKSKKMIESLTNLPVHYSKLFKRGHLGKMFDSIGRSFKSLKIDFDLIYTSKPNLHSFPGIWNKFFRGKDFFLDLDDLEGELGYGKYSFILNRKFNSFLELSMPRIADEIVVASFQLYKIFSKRSKIAHYVYNGVDPKEFDPDKIKGTDEFKGKRIILHVGMLNRFSDADLAIKAFLELKKEYDDLILLITSDGGKKDKLMKLAGDEDVVFTGFINFKKMLSYIKSAEIVLIPFRDNLTNACKCPLRLFEFMAMKKAIVASRIGECEIVLKDSESALLCNPGDFMDLKEKIKVLLNDSRLLKKLERNARKDILKTYNWNKIGKRLNSIFLKG